MFKGFNVHGKSSRDFICNLCEKDYFDEKDLKRHIKLVHSETKQETILSISKEILKNM